MYVKYTLHAGIEFEYICTTNDDWHERDKAVCMSSVTGFLVMWTIHTYLCTYLICVELAFQNMKYVVCTYVAVASLLLPLTLIVHLLVFYVLLRFAITLRMCVRMCPVCELFLHFLLFSDHLASAGTLCHLPSTTCLLVQKGGTFHKGQRSTERIFHRTGLHSLERRI